MIPRIAHFVWIGGPVPPAVQEIVGEFSDLHPRWDVRLHQSVPRDLPEHLARAVGHCEQYCQVADICYYWLLLKDGGFVLDTDVLAVRSFEPLLECGPAFTTRHSDKDKRLTNGVMGAEPGCRAMQICSEYLGIVVKGPPVERAGWGPGMLSYLFGNANARHRDELKVLPWHYFYPLLISEKELCAEFLVATAERREEILATVHDRYDGQPPYAVHLWGALNSSFTRVKK